MDQPFWLSTLAVLLGGLMQGSFLLPMRLARRWAWENIWMVYSIVGLLLVPWAAAVTTIPHLMSVYERVPISIVILTALFGFGWGVANVLFGLAVPIVGMALSFAVVVGMSAALGSLIPLVISAPDRLMQPTGLIVLLGVALMSLGITLLGIAGRARETAELRRGLLHSKSSAGMTAGLALCVLAGVLAPMLNYSFAFGSGIQEQAINLGAMPSQGANAIWLIALGGGFASNGGYSIMRLFRHSTWTSFRGKQTLAHYMLSALMGVLFTGGLILYGQGATGLGDLGPAIGWPIFQATIIILSSVLGIAMGEWRNAERPTFRTNIIGLGVLLVAIIVLSIGNRA